MTVMTDKANQKLKASGWTIVETTGFLHLIGPLWQRVVEGEHEYALVAQENHHNRRGSGAGRGAYDLRRPHLRHERALRIGQADAGDDPDGHALCRGRQDRRDSHLKATR